LGGRLSESSQPARFGGATTLRGVSHDVHAGEIVALLGENGAGKSKLIKTLGGIVEPTEGAIAYKGEPYRRRPPQFGQCFRADRVACLNPARRSAPRVSKLVLPPMNPIPRRPR
jgi:ABC-type branched-subunit amino acid transport system ATPase component